MGILLVGIFLKWTFILSRSTLCVYSVLYREIGALVEVVRDNMFYIVLCFIHRLD